MWTIWSLIYSTCISSILFPVEANAPELSHFDWCSRISIVHDTALVVVAFIQAKPIGYFLVILVIFVTNAALRTCIHTMLKWYTANIRSLFIRKVFVGLPQMKCRENLCANGVHQTVNSNGRRSCVEQHFCLLFLRQFSHALITLLNLSTDFPLAYKRRAYREESFFII